MEKNCQNQPNWQPPTPNQHGAVIAESDCIAIKESVSRAVEKRKDVINLLKTLEDAWKMAAHPSYKQEEGSSNEDSFPLATLEQAERKRKEVQRIENEIFLSFADLTTLKHEEQISLGNQIIKSPSNCNLEEMIALTDKTQLFFENEDRINKEFLKNIHEISRKTKFYLQEVVRIQAIECQNPRLQKLLTKNLSLLKEFLEATKQLLDG